MKYTEETLPTHLQLRVNHFHSGNSSNKKRHGKPYITVARIIDKETQIIVAKGKAMCSKTEAPSRKLGRTIAVNRALEQLS